jgi:pimeloyl-ACP methyl ester carboxylesterase
MQLAASAVERRSRWSRKSNPETGAKLEAELEYLRLAHNGGADIDLFIQSEYGDAYADALELGHRFEEDPTGLAIEEYYRSLGLRRQMFENTDYYTRWLLITPLEMETEAAKGRRYPVVFVNHGGFASISADEFIAGFPDIAASERVIIAMLQNTNVDNTLRVLDRLIELFPVDAERVYLVGESQGGYQATSTYFRAPERFAAVVTCGNDIWRDWDNVNTRFTENEVANVTETFVPFAQVVGQFEASSFAPVNDWAPRKDWGREPMLTPYRDPRRNDDVDPTRNANGPRRFSNQPEPPSGMDKHEWMLTRLNNRMASLRAAPRDPATCIGYLDGADTELHRVLGFYGDRERTESILGARHWIADIDNEDGLLAFRYVVIENAPHAWPVTAGALSWDFMKQYRRDTATGRIVVDEYSARDDAPTRTHKDVQENTP